MTEEPSRESFSTSLSRSVVWETWCPFKFKLWLLFSPSSFLLSLYFTVCLWCLLILKTFYLISVCIIFLWTNGKRWFHGWAELFWKKNVCLFGVLKIFVPWVIWSFPLTLFLSFFIFKWWNGKWLLIWKRDVYLSVFFWTFLESLCFSNFLGNSMEKVKNLENLISVLKLNF